jgi:hypothetical protein
VDNTVEDGVSEGWLTDDLVPLGLRQASHDFPTPQGPVMIRLCLRAIYWRQR